MTQVLNSPHLSLLVLYIL
uniref:Uncharacterized protein n=1 Tax=Arundo donax TaxID=35708 RepID=A0A0A9G3I2_ARUDO